MEGFVEAVKFSHRILYHLLAKHDIIGISYFKVVIELNLDYTGLLPSSIYEWKGIGFASCMR